MCAHSSPGVRWCSLRPVAMFQSHTPSRYPPVSASRPSGDKAIDRIVDIEPSGTEKLRNCRPLATSQSLIVVCPPDRTTFPSAESATAIASSCLILRNSRPLAISHRTSSPWTDEDGRLGTPFEKGGTSPLCHSEKRRPTRLRGQQQMEKNPAAADRFEDPGVSVFVQHQKAPTFHREK